MKLCKMNSTLIVSLFCLRNSPAGEGAQIHSSLIIREDSWFAVLLHSKCIQGRIMSEYKTKRQQNLTRDPMTHKLTARV